MNYHKMLLACIILSLTSCEIVSIPIHLGEALREMDNTGPLTMKKFIYSIDGYKISVLVPKMAKTTEGTLADGETFVSTDFNDCDYQAIIPPGYRRSINNISYAMTPYSLIDYYKYRNIKFGERMPEFMKIGKYNVLVSPEKKWFEVEINNNLYFKIEGGRPEDLKTRIDVKSVIRYMKIEEVPGVAHQTLLPDPRRLAINECRDKARSGLRDDCLKLYYALRQSSDFFEREEASDWLLKSADPQAQWELALHHYKNIDGGKEFINKDAEQLKSALQWIGHSAGNNHPEAQYVLGKWLWLGVCQLPMRGYNQPPTDSASYMDLR